MISPTTWLIAGLAAILAALGIYAAGHHAGTKSGRGEVQAQWDEAKAKQATEALQQAAANAAITEQRITDQAEVSRHAAKQSTQARADAAAAANADQRLRQRATAVAALACAAPADPAAAPVSAPASAPADLLADVLSRTLGAARQLAAECDARGIAGHAAEDAYDALTVRASR